MNSPYDVISLVGLIAPTTVIQSCDEPKNLLNRIPPCHRERAKRAWRSPFSLQLTLFYQKTCQIDMHPIYWTEVK